MTISIMGNNIIQASFPKDKKVITKEDLKCIFSDGIPKIAESPKLSPKPNLKEDWEQLKPSKSLQNNSEDSKTLRPSRGEGETNFGGNGMLVRKNSIFDSSLEFQEDEYTRHTKEAGDEKRKQRQDRGQPSQEARDEWEDVKPALKTSDIPITSRGITPNRSAFKPAEIPDIKLNFVDKAAKKEAESKKAGEKAADIKRQLDKILFGRENRISNNWEEEALQKINKTTNRKINSSPLDIKTTEDFLPFSQKKDNPLQGLFKVPENPEKVEEKNIKRSTDGLREERVSRKDDRSWETTSLPTKTKI
jgi:hypothetical protein